MNLMGHAKMINIRMISSLI